MANSARQVKPSPATAIGSVALFSVFPILSLLASNAEQVAFVSALRSAAAAVLGSLLLVAGARLALRDWPRAALLVIGALLLFFSYGHVYDLIRHVEISGVVLGRHRYLIPVWIAAGLVWLWVVLRLGSRISPRWMLALGALTVILPASSLIVRAMRTTLAPGPEVRAGPSAIETASAEALPDVYYIILDGYGRSDVLADLYAIDNSEFLEFLEQRGFYVAADARSNYSKTILSLASALNMQYLDEIVETQGVHSADRQPLIEMIQDSLVAQSLRTAGYQTVGFETGYPPTELTDAGVYLSDPGGASSASPLEWAARGANEFEIMLLQTTALRPALDKISEGQSLARSLISQPYRDHRRRVLFTLEELPGVSELPGPQFVFVHILVPHPPFVFGRNGEEVVQTRPFRLMDIEEYAPEEYTARYADQLLSLDTLLSNAIERILDTSERPPIIILQGDHGPGAYMSYSKPLTSNMRERMSILNAYLVPAEATRRLYSSISPVNSFRVLLDVLLGQTRPLLPDESFFTLDDTRLYNMINVTDRARSD